MTHNRVNVLCFSLLAICPAVGVQAAIIDFEPPTYSIGDLAGQDAWVQLTGDPTYTTILGPEGGSIAGFSSASIVGGASGTGGNLLTAYKNAVDSTGADGTGAFDLNVRFLYQKRQAGGFGGLYIGNDGLGDASAYVRVNDAAIEAIESGGSFVNLGSYTLDDIVEFSIDVDLDMALYAVSIRNQTLGEAGFTLLTPSPLSLAGVMTAGDVAVSISGLLAQTLYDNVAVTVLSPPQAAPAPAPLFLLIGGLASLGVSRMACRKDARKAPHWVGPRG